LRQHIARGNVKRLFLDGAQGLMSATVYPSRIRPLLTVLANDMRAQGVTTMLSDELRTFFGTNLELPASGTSTTADNIILMRYVELRARLRRVISVIKSRGDAHDNALREFAIRDDGVIVLDVFQDAEDLLSGAAHTIDEAAPARTRNQPSEPGEG
ncbi:MAG TPA: ATPase domain-containing protein, partial [Myxococcota bacterium]|nr:ATPase domain-containing protein [Myxococcota bacterium]